MNAFTVPREPQVITLREIARRAGLSVSAVSYALRNDPKIPLATAQRVQQVARRLGYREHPSVAALMMHIRRAQRPRHAEKIAFVWVEAAPTEVNEPFNRLMISGVRQRSDQLGYAFEEFWLTARGMTPRRLTQILRARGISGVVFSACDRQTAVRLDVDWAALAPAIIGNAVWEPELHRAACHHALSMRRVLHELDRRGYGRPVALLERLVNERAGRSWEAAFLVYHPQPARARAMLRGFDEVDVEDWRAWLARIRPDAVILSKPMFVAPVRAIARELGLDVGIAVLDLLGPSGDLSGIDAAHTMVAANAVDLVVGQLYRNERGVPAEPKKLLFEGHWVEGRTLRPRPDNARDVARPR